MPPRDLLPGRRQPQRLHPLLLLRRYGALQELHAHPPGGGGRHSPHSWVWNAGRGPVTLGAPTESPLTCPQLVDMQGWTLLSGDRQVVPHELRAEAELLHADLRHAPDALSELYWQAPPSYLGDRVSGPSGRCPWGPHECPSANVLYRRLWVPGQGPARSRSSVRPPGVLLRRDPPLRAALRVPAGRRVCAHRKQAGCGAAGG